MLQVVKHALARNPTSLAGDFLGGAALTIILVASLSLPGLV